MNKQTALERIDTFLYFTSCLIIKKRYYLFEIKLNECYNTCVYVVFIIDRR